MTAAVGPSHPVDPVEPERARAVAAALARAGRAVEEEAAAVRRAAPASWRGAAADAARRERARAVTDLGRTAAALDLAARACAARADRAAAGPGPGADHACAAGLSEARALLPVSGSGQQAVADAAPAPVGAAPPVTALLVLGLLRLTWAGPGEVRRWWQALTPSQQDHLVRAAPALVGAADGLPADARDRANRSRLARDLADGSPGATVVAAALEVGHDRDDPATGDPLAVLLLDYAPSAFAGDGRAVVALGDPDLADDVGVLVPGLGSDLGALPGVTRDALHLQQAASDQGSATAVLAWLGYDAPDAAPPAAGDRPTASLRDLAGVADQDAAARGAVRLTRAAAGLGLPGGTPADPPAHVTVVGHSYGSTVAALAFGAAGGAPPADDLVLLGSPGAGAGVDRAADLHAGHGPGRPGVHVAADDRDPVTWLGGPGPAGLGPDPSQASFGAHRLPTASGDPLPGPGGADLVAQVRRHHGAYLDPGGPTLDAVADVVRGDPTAGVPGRVRSARSLMVRWITGTGPPSASSAH